MMRHRPAPGVQHRREADLYTQPLWIGRDRQQRVGARLEQEVVDDALVLVGDGADARRHREHDVEIGRLQQLGLACFHPLTRLAALALRAVPITAAIVGDGRVPARGVLAARNVPAEVRRAAGLDRAHHLELGVREVALHGATPCRAVVAEDIRDLQRRTGHLSRSTRPAPSLAWLSGSAASGGRAGSRWCAEYWWRRACNVRAYPTSHGPATLG